MGQMRNAYKMLIGKPEGIEITWKSQNNIKIDLIK
jgi:hypothetical protein